MSYHHTQRGPLHYILFAVLAGMLAGAWLSREEPLVSFVLTGAALLLFVLALSFAHLTVQDEGDRLAVFYGPLPLFYKSIPYAEMAAVEPCRSALVDGWGIHYIPGRGWTYNLWGRGCAKITLRNGGVIRVGSDEAGNLVDFLRTRIPAASAGHKQQSAGNRESE